MTVTLKQVEAVPVTYPATPTGLTTGAAALDAAMIWQRIEAYILHRFSARAVTWTVEGPGDWVPPLTPATISTVEAWDGEAWVAASPAASPLGGYTLASEGPYRVTASVGGGTVPAAVAEAFRRLAAYIGDGQDDHFGVTSYKVAVGPVDTSFERPLTWLAKAMINSGAGDLLRPYREAF